MFFFITRAAIEGEKMEGIQRFEMDLLGEEREKETNREN